MKIVGYCRVSTKGQTLEDRFGLETQKGAIRLWAEKEGHEIVGWFVDAGVSGVKEERPEFDKLIYHDEWGAPRIEAVVVAKSDRVARDIMVYYYFKHELLKKGVKLISISEDFAQMGEFAPVMEALIVVMANMERENISKRMSAGRITKARQGGFAGGKAPYGYRVKGKQLSIDPLEADAVRIIFSRDDLSLRKMAAFLDKAGFPTRDGGPWGYSTVRSIRANRKFYEGEYTYAGMAAVRGKHEPILVEGEI